MGRTNPIKRFFSLFSPKTDKNPQTKELIALKNEQMKDYEQAFEELESLRLGLEENRREKEAKIQALEAQLEELGIETDVSQSQQDETDPPSQLLLANFLDGEDDTSNSELSEKIISAKESLEKLVITRSLFQACGEELQQNRGMQNGKR